MATVNVFAVTIHIKNEVTGEPHVHYLTLDRKQAQAFAYSVAEALGVRYEISFWPNLQEGTLYPCYSCEEARDRISVASEYKW